jgi:hypothetical protein
MGRKPQVRLTHDKGFSWQAPILIALLAPVSLANAWFSGSE